jgi:hypothetical protein
MRLSSGRATRQRDRHAPVEVARDGARLEVGDEVLAELQDVRAPAGTGLQPRAERIGEGRQLEEELRRLLEPRGLAVDLAARVDEVLRVELVAAAVALVAARAVVGADRAGALDVAVGQAAAVDGSIGRQLRALDDVAVGVQRR